MVLATFLQLLTLFFFAHSIPVDNGVEGEPEIECGSTTITVNFNTRNAFEGHVYVKGSKFGLLASGPEWSLHHPWNRLHRNFRGIHGYSIPSSSKCMELIVHGFFSDKRCRSDDGGRQVAGIVTPFDGCGSQRSRSLNPKGIFVQTTIVISFHPHFLTKVDRAYRVSCFYMESNKDVNSRLDVAELTTASVTGLVPMPVCRYDTDCFVQSSSIFTANTFCMLVHSCSVDDGKGDRVSILDSDGCAIDRYVLNNIEYPEDLLAGQEAHVYKYADRESLFYQCQISIQIKESGECQRPVCPDLLGPSPVRVFSKSRQGLLPLMQSGGSLHVSTPHPFQESTAAYEKEYQKHHKVKVFGPGPMYKVEGGPSAELRLVRKRRSRSSTIDRSLTVDVRAEMTALDIEDGNYTIPTSSTKQYCLTHRMLTVSLSFIIVIICTLLSMVVVIAVRMSSAL